MKKAAMRILKEVFHRIITTSDKLVTFGLACKECGKNRQIGRFKLNTEFLLEEEFEFCSRGDHQIDKETKLLSSSLNESRRQESNAPKGYQEELYTGRL